MYSASLLESVDQSSLSPLGATVDVTRTQADALADLVLRARLKRKLSEHELGMVTALGAMRVHALEHATVLRIRVRDIELVADALGIDFGLVSGIFAPVSQARLEAAATVAAAVLNDYLNGEVQVAVDTVRELVIDVALRQSNPDVGVHRRISHRYDRPHLLPRYRS